MLINVSIVLFQNDKDIVRKAIESSLSSSLVKCIYLVDNSPTNLLSELADGIRIFYFHNPKNPGFGASHNFAISKSINEGANYHLVVNPDIFFDDRVVPVLLTYMEENLDIANVMPMVYYPDKRIQFLCKLLPTPTDWIGRRFNPIRSMVNSRNEYFELRFTKYLKEMDVPYLSGCFMFLRITALKKVGLFDENIFMYGEETDLCRRLIRVGYRTVFNPNVYIIHEFQKGSHKTWRLTWIGIRSAIYYFNKWGWFFDNERKKINTEVLNKLKNG